LTYQLLRVESLPGTLQDVRDVLSGASGTTLARDAVPAAVPPNHFVLVSSTASPPEDLIRSFANGLKFAITKLVPLHVSTWNTSLIMDLHHTVCPHVAYGFRQHNVKHGEPTMPPHFLEVPTLMEIFLSSLSFFYNSDCVDNVLVAIHALLHFGWIHPFPDCNGRTGRLLMTALLLQEGVVPPYFELVQDVSELTLVFTEAYLGDSTAAVDLILSNMLDSVTSLKLNSKDRRNADSVRAFDWPESWTGFGTRGTSFSEL